MAQVHRQGLTLLSRDAGCHQPNLNIIFIHGLRGHPRNTWSLEAEGKENEDAQKDKRRRLKTILRLKEKQRQDCRNATKTDTTSPDHFWPEEYLVQDLPQARVWTYGYKADVVGGLFQANNQNSVSQHGQDLAINLERNLDNPDPIAFVVHSLGGIITKIALHKSEVIRTRTRLIVFLGTPHRGSAYATWGGIAANLASLGLQDSNKKLVQALSVNGEVLDNIHEEFKMILSKRGIKVHSFQEAKGISGMKGLDNKVVDNFSSKLDLARDQETVETIDANHMQMARCSSREDVRYRQISGVLKQFVKTELCESKVHSAGGADAISRTRLFTVPFSRDDNFVGRQDILEALQTNGQQELAIKHRRDALVGLGGIGKSQIAIEYAYRVWTQDPQMMVFWIHASTRARFKHAYQEIADKLALPGHDDAKVNVLRLVQNWLMDEGNGRWLMILDNVDEDSVFFDSDPSSSSTHTGDGEVGVQQPPLETFVPQSRHGSVLITSRNMIAAENFVGMFGDCLSIEPMGHSDSIELLKTRISSCQSSETDLEELAIGLEGIPLAITHAAAYIRSRPRITVTAYLTLFRENEANCADLLSSNDMKDLRRDHSARHAVLAAWQISINQIQQTNPQAVSLLALMSMFDRQGIPELLLRRETNRLQFEDAIAPLISFSLIREQSDSDKFEMHWLVQIAMRKWVELRGELQHWQSKAIEIMASSLPQGEYEAWPLCQTLLPHMLQVLSYKGASGGGRLNAARIHHNFGWFLVLKDEWFWAERSFRTAMMGREAELGVSHPDTLASMNSHALTLSLFDTSPQLLRFLIDIAEAEEMHRRVLEIREKKLGASHPDTLVSVRCLASTLADQKKYDSAVKLFQRVCDECEAVLGPLDPLTRACQKEYHSLLREMSQSTDLKCG